LQLLIVKCF